MPPIYRPAHAATRIEQRRTYDRARAGLYDWRALYKTARWQAVRSRQLRDHPLCVMCERAGALTAATVCDHVERHRGDPERFFAGPFQSLCKPHHDRDKQRAERARSASTDGADR